MTSLSKARSQAHFLERTGDRRRASEGLQDKGTEWKVTYPRILARAARNAKGSTAKGSTALARAERGVATVAAVHADSLSTTTTATADRLDMLFDELGEKGGECKARIARALDGPRVHPEAQLSDDQKQHASGTSCSSSTRLPPCSHRLISSGPSVYAIRCMPSVCVGVWLTLASRQTEIRTAC